MLLRACMLLLRRDPPPVTDALLSHGLRLPQAADPPSDLQRSAWGQEAQLVRLHLPRANLRRQATENASRLGQTDHLQIIYRSPTYHLQIISRSSTDHPQNIHRTSTDRPQIICRSSTDHRSSLNDLDRSRQIDRSLISMIQLMLPGGSRVICTSYAAQVFWVGSAL